MFIRACANETTSTHSARKTLHHQRRRHEPERNNGTGDGLVKLLRFRGEVDAFGRPLTLSVFHSAPEDGAGSED